MGCIKVIDQGRYRFAIDENGMTARLLRIPRLGRKTRYRVPSYVDWGGRRYTVNDIDIGCIGKGKCLRHIVFPDTVEYIDEDNMHGCPNLRSIYFGKALRFINSWIFKSEYRPRKIVIREGVVEILGVAFWFNSRLRQVVLPSSLRIINSDAFAWCTSLREINIPESVEKIGSQCFEGCNLNC